MFGVNFDHSPLVLPVEEVRLWIVCHLDPAFKQDIGYDDDDNKM